MKVRILHVMGILALAAAVYGAAGIQVQGPEQLGAHWVHLSDRAQLECIIDGLRHARPGGAAQQIMLRNAGAGKSLQIVETLKRSG